MSPAKMALLSDRGVVRVAGEEAGRLLQGIITNDMDLLARQSAMHAALLTPQGKMLFEFLVVTADGGFLLETGRDKATDLAKRLLLYRLRAKATIEDVSPQFTVAAVWGGPPPAGPRTPSAVVFEDPRLAALGHRELISVPPGSPAGGLGDTASPEAYHTHRIALGVPEAGKDYQLGDTFPHEALLDQLNGVSFDKGCFVGQEVVSRMQHRGGGRKRVVPVEGAAPLKSGAEVKAGAATIGMIGSVAGQQALAMIRLDRAAEAKVKGEPLLAGGVTITLRKPDWATFDLAPGAAAEAP